MFFTRLKTFFLNDGAFRILHAFFIIAFVATGLIQFVAILNFLHQIWGWWQIPSVLPAVVLAYIPVIGSFAGAYAAYTVWAWPIWSLVLLFWPLILFGLVSLAERLFKKD